MTQSQNGSQSGPQNGHDWHEWRGATTAKLGATHDSVKEVKEDVKNLYNLHSEMDKKLARYGGLAAALVILLQVMQVVAVFLR